MDPLSITRLQGVSVLDLGLDQILMRIGLSFVLGLCVAFTYRRTHKAFAYSYGMVLAMVLISMIVAMVLMVIDNSLARAFGLVGALSIIRFRTPVKDIRDIMYLFVAIGAGIAVGAGAYRIAVVSVLGILMVSYLLFYLKFGQKQTEELLIKLFATRGAIDTPAGHYESILTEHCRSFSLIELQSEPDGSVEMVYSVRLLDSSKVPEIVRRMTADENIKRVSVLSAIHNMDVQ